MADKFTNSDPYVHGIDVPDRGSDPVHAVNTSVWETIEWETPDLPAEVQEARAAVACELHYLYMTHLTMLGGIVQDEPDTDMKRLAAVLTDDRMRNVDAWSKYLSALGENTTVTADMDKHADALLSADSLCQLTSIVLADVFLATLYEHMDDDGSLFRRLLERDITQAQKNVGMAIDYLQQWQQELPGSRKEAVLDHVRTCVQWAEVYVDRHQTVLANAGIAPEAFATAFRENAQEFYDHIRPPEQS